MADDAPPTIPADALLGEDAIAAGMAAMEQIHGRHLADMNEHEQAEARQHWRRQVESVLASVHAFYADPTPPGVGRAVISFTDGDEDRIDVSVAFQPDLEDMGDGQVAGTPAQVLALSALEALSDDPGDSEAPE